MKHEEKKCPRCDGPFECKVGLVHACQCSTVSLSAHERAFVREKFTDCLCAGCLKALRAEYHAGRLNQTLHKLLRKA